MTFTKENNSSHQNNSSIAGIRLVLQPTSSTNAISLTHWLSELESAPVLVPLAKQQGVQKVMAVTANAKNYPAIMQQVVQQISCRTVLEWQGKCYELTGIEVDNHELYVLEIPFFPSAPLPPTLGRALHAQCLQWLGRADPDLAEYLHNAEFFPITLVMKPGTSRTQMFLRIGLVQGNLLAPLLWGMSQDMNVDVAWTGIDCRLGKWIEIKQSTTFEALTQLPTQRLIHLDFFSPTSFKQGQKIQPFPLPELVFSSLLRKWNMLAPENLQFPLIEWQGLTAAYDLKTLAMKMKAGAEIGAKGWVKYEFSEPEQAKIATILAHFAAFAGVGRKTAMGMGQTQLITSD
jgi:CRISPR-associated endoribonuclease Cas6